MPDAGCSTHDQTDIRPQPASNAPVTPTPLRLALQNIRHSAHLASRNTWHPGAIRTSGMPDAPASHKPALVHQRREPATGAPQTRIGRVEDQEVLHKAIPDGGDVLTMPG